MEKAVIFLTVLFIFLFSNAFGQIDVKEKVKNEAVNRAETKTNEVIDKTFNKLEKGIGEIFKKKNKTNNEDKAAVKDNEKAISKETSKSDTSQQTKIKFESYTQYDFVPGDEVLYFDDFSEYAVGDFPAYWTSSGSGEIKTTNIAPGNWLHINTNGSYTCHTKQFELPANFIMEFDVIPDANFYRGHHLTFYQENEYRELNDDLYPGLKGLHIHFNSDFWEIRGYSNEGDNDPILEGKSDKNPVIKEEVNHVIIWIQNRRLRVYHQGDKVVDMPTIIYAGTKFNRFLFNGWDTESTPYISNLKITTAAPDTRSKLITEGKLISYGINFDVNSHTIKPESYGALNDIAKVLQEVPNVKIKIIGHTDSDGNQEKNLDLSKRRAESVKNALSNNFGIDASRIQTEGAGQSMPLVPNTTAQEKLKNRRVEFIKI